MILTLLEALERDIQAIDEWNDLDYPFPVE